MIETKTDLKSIHINFANLNNLQLNAHIYM